MNITDATIIQAFTAVLPRLEMMLAPEIKQSVHHVGYELAQHHAEKAARQIFDLVQHHRCLEEPFRSLHKTFEHRYQSGIQGSSSDSDLSTESLELLIETMTVPILRAEEFVASARNIVRQALHHDNALPDVMHFFIICLQKAVSTSDEQVNNILHALEQQLLSVEDIAHLLNISVEQAHYIVNHLWAWGYIDSAKSSVMGRAVAAFTRSPRSMPSVNHTTHFVLTSRGHFHLHPFLIAKREDRLE
ncbi:MAG: hypothetical protein AAF327_19985 [Cyanobacteria bacterium P01_A01_bin.37]